MPWESLLMNCNFVFFFTQLNPNSYIPKQMITNTAVALIGKTCSNSNFKLFIQHVLFSLTSPRFRVKSNYLWFGFWHISRSLEVVYQMKSMQLPMLKCKGRSIKKKSLLWIYFNTSEKVIFLYLWQQFSQAVVIKQQLPRINQLLVLFRLWRKKTKTRITCSAKH